MSSEEWQEIECSPCIEDEFVDDEVWDYDTVEELMDEFECV